VRIISFTSFLHDYNVNGVSYVNIKFQKSFVMSCHLDNYLFFGFARSILRLP